MQIVLMKHGYRGYVGIEYEGRRLSEKEGILATKRLLERIRTEFTAAQSQQADQAHNLSAVLTNWD
jgi:hypothetical protein